jgi:hypothetical protein
MDRILTVWHVRSSYRFGLATVLHRIVTGNSSTKRFRADAMQPTRPSPYHDMLTRKKKAAWGFLPGRLFVQPLAPPGPQPDSAGLFL